MPRLGASGPLPLLRDFAGQERVSATSQIALLLFCAAFPFTFIFSYVSPMLGLPVVVFEVCFLSVVVLNKFNRDVVAKMLLLGTANGGAFFYSFILGPPSGVPLLLIAFAGLPLVVFPPHDRARVISGIILPIVLQVIVQSVPNHILAFNVSADYLRAINITAVFSVTLIIVIYVWFFSGLMLNYSNRLLETNNELKSLFDSEAELRNQYQRQAEKLEKANDELKIKAELDKEIHAVKLIQDRIFPRSAPSYRGYDIDHFFLPAKQVSGDYYDYFPLSTHQVGILICDVVGKGIPANIMMITLKGLVHTAAAKKLSPAKTCELLNRNVYWNSILGKYVPMIYAVLDTKRHTFTYCNAGHEPAWVIRGQSLIELREGGVPLGAFETELFEDETIHLDPHDRIVLFTDGTTDAENRDQDTLKIHRMLDIITRRNDQSDGMDYVDSVGNDVVEFMSGAPQVDDITILSLKRKA